MDFLCALTGICWKCPAAQKLVRGAVILRDMQGCPSCQQLNSLILFASFRSAKISFSPRCSHLTRVGDVEQDRDPDLMSSGHGKDHTFAPLILQQIQSSLA
jgi:hypothetical protein